VTVTFSNKSFEIYKHEIHRTIIKISFIIPLRFNDNTVYGKPILKVNFLTHEQNHQGFNISPTPSRFNDNKR